MTVRKSCYQPQVPSTLIPPAALHILHVAGSFPEVALNAWISVPLPDKGESISTLVALSFYFSQQILQEIIIFLQLPSE